MFSKFTIRTRIGLIVAVSFIAIIGLSVTLLMQARERFMDQLREGSVNQVRMIHQALTGLDDRVRSGEITETEAKRLGRFMINNTIVDERNYLLLYHRLGQLLAHPVRGVDSALDTDEQVRQSMAAAATTEEQRLAQSGYRDPAPTMPEIIRRYTGDSYTGFSEYLYFPETLFGYRILTFTDDPLAHPQAELKLSTPNCLRHGAGSLSTACMRTMFALNFPVGSQFSCHHPADADCTGCCRLLPVVINYLAAAQG